MWIGLILTFIFGAIIAGFCIWGIIDCYCPKNKILHQDQYRYEIEKEKPDYFYSFPHYDTEMSKEQQSRYTKYKKKEEKKANIKKSLFVCVPIIVWLFAIFGFGYLGAFLDNESLARQVEKYKSTKYTIEASLRNDDLTGLEKIELVKQASEQNSWLAEKKYEVKQWYRFYLDKDIVLELEMIDLEKEN